MASSGAGDVDRVFAREVGDRYQVFEVKGGKSPIGDCLITDVKDVAKNSVAQQGTKAYLKQIIHEMKQKPKSRKAGIRLESALKKGKIDYLYYRQGFKESGEFMAPQIGQFDIRTNGKTRKTVSDGNK